MAEDRLNQAIATALARMDKSADEMPDSGLSDDEAQILSLLGAAVVAEWANIPRETQRTLFERATRLGAPGGDFTLRQDIATFLHDHHERTAPNGDAAQGGAGQGDGPA
ncbi:MAG: hypothetical protein ACK4MV_17185 [Beijerinckiaceae bacterium]